MANEEGDMVVFPENFGFSHLGLNFQRTRLRIAVIGVCLAMGSGVADAQTQAPSTSEVFQAEALLWGAPEVGDAEESLAVLEAAAMSGDATAQYFLGRHLLNGWVIPQDKSRGLQLLEASAEAKHTGALVDLGKEFLWGLNIPSDSTRAIDYLEKASAQNDVSAKRILGEQLVLGDVLPRDVARGTALLEEAISAGDVEAHVALGQLYLQGIGVSRDQDLALALFETAAQAGNGHGLAAYGDALMWSQRDPVQAEAILNRAGEMQASEAWVSLAHGAMYGYLGSGRVSRAKFDGYAEKARAAGEEKIAVLEAERKMWGINMRASGPEAIAGLRSAAESGNAKAAGFLIELLRDGNGLNVRRQPDQARSALFEFRELFSEKRYDQYAMSIDAALARRRQDYAPMVDAFNARPDLQSRWFGTQIAKANLNVAFYVLQEKLASEGRYNGPINGYATPSTLVAASRLCQDLGLNEHCKDTVLEPNVVGALMTH
jgi:TPR repeat protein